MQNPLAAFVPGRDGQFDRAAAAHLLRRAGFGAAPAEIRRLVSLGLTTGVESLFLDVDDEEAASKALFEQSRALLDYSDMASLEAWWCYRMVQTRVPLREKLTLFWHGHFATSYNKVGDAHLMYLQNETLRRLAWGNLRELVTAIAKDPAMLVYLDGETNSKEHPNENFARELMELFTCGPGHYTEKDVLEAARAFTGWHRTGTQFFFNEDAHDGGPKTFLGRTGAFDGGDIIDRLVDHPATARFIARKLLRFFACAAPPDAIVEQAAAHLVSVGLSTSAFLKTLFRSRFFYSPECVRTRIASPAEFVIGSIRTLGAYVPANRVYYHLTAMGQELFAPPNVKGWDGEDKWINASTLAARLSYAQSMADLVAYNEFSPTLRLDQIVSTEVKDPGKVATALCNVLLHGEVPSDIRKVLADFLVTSPDGTRNAQQFLEDADFRAGQARRAVGALLSLAEYQRC